MFVLKKIIITGIFSLMTIGLFSCGKNFTSKLDEPVRGGGDVNPDEMLTRSSPTNKRMILFSSTICSSCVTEHKEIIKYLDGRKPEKIDIVTYMTGGDDTESVVNSWVQNVVKGINWPVKIDYGQMYFKKLCQNITPCTVIFDEKSRKTYAASKTHTMEELLELTGPWFNKTEEPVEPKKPETIANETFPSLSNGKMTVALISLTNDVPTFDLTRLIANKVNDNFLKINLYNLFIGSKTIKSQIEQFKDLTTMTWPFLFNQTEEFAQAFCPNGTPCLVILDKDNKLTYSGKIPSTYEEVENLVGGPLCSESNLAYAKNEVVDLPTKKFEAYDPQTQKVSEIGFKEQENKMTLILAAGITCQACVEEHTIISERFEEIKNKVNIFSIVGGLRLNDQEKIDLWQNNSHALWPSFGSPTYGELMEPLITKENYDLSTPAMLLIDKDNKFIYGHAFDTSLPEEAELSPKDAVEHLIKVIKNH